jgi:hypothetical protein
MSLSRSSVQNAHELHSTVQTDHYSGPEGGTSYQKGYRTSQEGAGNYSNSGTAFSSKQLLSGRVAGLSASNRSSLVNWDAGATNPGFNQN